VFEARVDPKFVAPSSHDALVERAMTSLRPPLHAVRVAGHPQILTNGCQRGGI
jgi:hypothetical protein